MPGPGRRARKDALLAGRDQQLLLHEVDAARRLRDRVLHLQACVHLQEEEVAVRREDALDGAGPPVADGLHRFQGRFGHALPEIVLHRGGRGLLDHLLVPALHRALPFVQVDPGARPVEQDLDLHVPGALDEALQVHGRVGEEPGPAGGGGLHRLCQPGLVARDAHADPAPAHHRLHHHREPHPAARIDRFRR